jgi:hypothetical protein
MNFPLSQLRVSAESSAHRQPIYLMAVSESNPKDKIGTPLVEAEDISPRPKNGEEQ